MDLLRLANRHVMEYFINIKGTCLERADIVTKLICRILQQKPETSIYEILFAYVCWLHGNGDITVIRNNYTNNMQTSVSDIT